MLGIIISFAIGCVAGGVTGIIWSKRAKSWGRKQAGNVIEKIGGK